MKKLVKETQTKEKPNKRTDKMAGDLLKAHGQYPKIIFLIVCNFFGALGAFTIGSWLIDASHAPSLGRLFLILQEDDEGDLGRPGMDEDIARDTKSNLAVITNCWYVSGVLVIMGGIVTFTWNLVDLLIVIFLPDCWISQQYLEIFKADDVADTQEEQEDQTTEQH